MNTFILILVLATGNYKVGAASVVQEFNSEAACVAALATLLKDSQTRGNFVLTSGCFKK